MKSYSFYSYKLNKDKFNMIKDYAIKVNINKNNLSKCVYNNLLLDLYYNKLSKYDFINQTKHLREDIGSQIYQQLQIDVYTKYKNMLDKLNYKSKSNTKLSITITYLVKVYKNNKEYVIEYLSKSKKEYHKEILKHINKFKDKLFKLVENIQNRLLKNFKVIVFNQLTFNGINQLSNRQNTIEHSKLKLTNAIINFNLPKIGKIIIPVRYNKNYHSKLSDYKHSYTKNNQSQISYMLKIENDRVRIIFAKESNDNLELEIDNENVIGIDINTKNNLFSLSDGEFIKYDKWIIEKYKRLEKKISKMQKTKEKRNIEDKTYGKKLLKRVQKMNRISKYYNDLKSNQLIKYCKDKGIKHIVMEDLNLNSKNKYKLKKEGVNYRNIIKVLHLNDYKNVIRRIGNRDGIMISYVNPEYTSQTCSKCGHISRENRKTQETFSCVKCNYTLNADTNASINIKNRISNDYLREELQEYDNKLLMYIGKRYITKKEYEKIYEKIYNNN